MSSLLASHKKWMPFIILLVVLSFATPALADYLGPNRTVTQTTGACEVVLYRCRYVPSKDIYAYRRAADWSCTNTNEPWQAYPDSPPGSCTNDSQGDEYWSKENNSQEITTTYPAATISGGLQNCSLQNGWCGGTAPLLSLNASEPVAGYSITLIEGTLNGQIFACPNGATSCNVPLNEGDNNFSYWALSTWGDSSYMGTLQARVDTVSPDLSLNISGATGNNGWYVSPTTVTAVGVDATSGLASALLSVNSGAWLPAATLNEGVHTLDVLASDNAGNVATSVATIAVDTTTPSITMSIQGTAGLNGWYISITQVSAVANDATSGVASLEVSADGAAYQAYTAPVSFSDGVHTIQFRATDTAGNLTETALQTLFVDTVPPAIDLPKAWQLGRNVPYGVNDAGSGLGSLRLVIEDEDERYAKLAWDERVAGRSYSEDIDWDGGFKDGTLAPAGTYLVWIKAADQAGNESIKLGKVSVPAPDSVSNPLPLEDASLLGTPLPPAELSSDQIPPMTIDPSEFGFGGEVAQPEEVITHSLVLSTGLAGSNSMAASNVLWGTAAAAAASAATAFVLAERRKREEAEAQQAAQLRAQIAHDEERRAEKKQKQQENWDKQEAERQAAILSNMEKNLAKLEAQERRLELERAHREALNPPPRVDLSRFGTKQNRDWVDTEMAMAAREHYVEKAKAEAEWEEEQKRKNAMWITRTEQFAERYESPQTARDTPPPPPPSNWWEKTKSAIKENVIEPFDQDIYQPFLKPAIAWSRDRAQEADIWLNDHVYEPWIKPQWDRMKQDMATFAERWDENVVQPVIRPAIENIKLQAAEDIARFKKSIYEPYIKPGIDRVVEDVKHDIKWVNDHIYQPYVKPALKVLNERVYQPYVQPAINLIAEKISQPVLQTIDIVKTKATQLVEWANETIYEPVFAPVVNDIKKHIIEPATKWWGQYGEWVHTALDVAGFIPLIGEAFDGVNGLIYLCEGHYLEAGLSLVSAVPFLGNIAPAGKIALKGNWAGVGRVAGEIYDSYNAVVDTVSSPFLNLFRKGALEKSATEIAQKAANEAVETTAQNSTKSLGRKIMDELPTDSMGRTHLGLGVAGSLPATSNAAAIADALLYLKQGKRVDAAMSAVSMIPGVGDILTTVKSVGDDAFVRATKRTAREMGAKEVAEAGSEALAREATEVPLKPRRRTIELPDDSEHAAERTTSEETEQATTATPVPSVPEQAVATVTDLTFTPASQRTRERDNIPASTFDLTSVALIKDANENTPVRVSKDTAPEIPSGVTTATKRENRKVTASPAKTTTEQQPLDVSTTAVVEKATAKPSEDAHADSVTPEKGNPGTDTGLNENQAIECLTTEPPAGSEEVLSVNALTQKYGDDAAALIKTYDERGISLLEQYGDDAFLLVKWSERLGVDPTDILDDPPMPGQSLEGWLLKITDPDSPVNKATYLQLSESENNQLLTQSLHNIESEEIVLGYFDPNKEKGYIELARKRTAGHLMMAQELYKDVGFRDDSGDFWQINRAAIQHGLDQRKTFVLSTDLATILSNPKKFTYAEIKMILHPGNNYVQIHKDGYDMLVPAESLVS